jgi:prevent-host-death family protein
MTMSKATGRRAVPWTMAAAEFKSRCLQLMEEVSRTRRPLTVTKRGRPVVTLVPAQAPPPFLGRLEGEFRVVGDVTRPTADLAGWDAEILREWDELNRDNPPR